METHYFDLQSLSTLLYVSYKFVKFQQRFYRNLIISITYLRTFIYLVMFSFSLLNFQLANACRHRGIVINGINCNTQSTQSDIWVDIRLAQWTHSTLDGERYNAVLCQTTMEGSSEFQHDREQVAEW